MRIGDTKNERATPGWEGDGPPEPPMWISAPKTIPLGNERLTPECVFRLLEMGVGHILNCSRDRLSRSVNPRVHSNGRYRLPALWNARCSDEWRDVSIVPPQRRWDGGDG
jgi:hypothetical protein